jgi:hypothetical protein
LGYIAVLIDKEVEYPYYGDIREFLNKERDDEPAHGQFGLLSHRPL